MQVDQAKGRGTRRAPDETTVAPGLEPVYHALREQPIFGDLPDGVLASALNRGELTLRRYWRDDLVTDAATLAAEGPRVHLVRTGQLAAAVFPAGLLAEERRDAAGVTEEEKRQKIRARGPLIRLAEKNLATFGEGELYNSTALAAVDHELGGDRLACYAVAPSDVIVADAQWLGELAVAFPRFGARLRRALDALSLRLRSVSGAKQEVLDFFVRHGLSVATTMRVRQVDLCIECKECERACEERYGHKRLEIHGPRLGMLDFVYACRTCTDQRCVSPCNYDSIKFDADRGEVVINEASCTGCGACAEACPYGSIEMVNLFDPKEQLFRVRLEGKYALGHGEGAGRALPAFEIASKCDHCAAFSDQACVSRCPTGALIEITPAELFRDDGELASAGARAGFEHTMIRSVGEVHPTAPFEKGLGIVDGAAARVSRRRVSPLLMWGLGLAGFFGALVEIVLRLRAPTWSLEYAWHRMEGLEPGIARLKVGYNPGSDLAVVLGISGVVLLVIGMLYPMRKRWRWLARIGSSAAWFDLHIAGGVLGPLYVTLHSSLKLDNWVSLAFWSMMLVVLSGIIGRYLYTQVPALLHGGELEEVDLGRALLAWRGQYPDAVGWLEQEAWHYRARLRAAAARGGVVYALGWMIADDFARPARWLRRRALLVHAGAPPPVRRELRRLVGRVLLLERRRALVPRVHGMLLQWKKVHVPFTFAMMAVTVVHIVVALTYSM